MLLEVVKSISKSSSLMGVHLDGNPGLTDNFHSFCKNTLSASDDAYNHIPAPPS
jgi:hypothetical protein